MHRILNMFDGRICFQKSEREDLDQMFEIAKLKIIGKSLYNWLDSLFSIKSFLFFQNGFRFLSKKIKTEIREFSKYWVCQEHYKGQSNSLHQTDE